MSKIKVVRVVTASYVVPWHLANTLSRIADDFEVTVLGQGVSDYSKDYPGIQWQDINLNRKINPIADLISLYQLCRFFLRYRPDIVHSIMPKAGLLTAVAGWICRVPVRIHTFTGQVWAGKGSKFWRLFYAADKLINTLNTVCLTDSPSQSQFLLEHGITHQGAALAVLGKGSLSGVDLTRFVAADIKTSAQKLRHSLGIQPDYFVFAFIARKSRDKGAIDVLNAFAELVKELPHCVLLFVGPDESAGELTRLKTEQPGLFNSVIEVDKVSRHESYLAITDVLCLPSYREGFGSIVIDAAAMAVPTIGSDIVGLVDAIEAGQTGLLFPAGDVQQLKQAMRGLMQQPSLAKQMGEAARQRVIKNFSADTLYAALKSFYLTTDQGIQR